ncbi:hypothetical protein ACG0Z6_06980 [Roseateles sp. BYS180W]|uniref:DUF2189 domain-containing protein n=1 Tax=Roseateles rivi TaxID=3299028 RepID=A0ABW7FUJ3_9BURK
MTESALAHEQRLLAGVYGGGALAVAFYGVQATGLMLMDQAMGLVSRDPVQAWRDALQVGHRSLLSVLCWALGVAMALTLLGALMWAVRLPVVGVPLLTLVLPLGVVGCGLTMVSTGLVVGPLSGPSVWAGGDTRQTLAWIRRVLTRQLPEAALLSFAVLLLTALVSAAVSAVVLSGARLMGLLLPWVAQLDLPPQQLMAGLFGYGLRSLGASGAPVTASPQGIASLAGGGMVFVLALVLPALVYIRGSCAAYLALDELAEPR